MPAERPTVDDDTIDRREPDVAHADLHADEAADLARDLTNGELARIFHEIGDILEVKGELRFKTLAYHRAADAIGRSPVDLVAAYRTGNPPKVPGVGQAISDKIAEQVTTGQMRFLEKLRAEIPASLVELLQIPGLGPRTVRQLHEELGITTIDELRTAAANESIRGVRGLSERTEQLILEGIARLESQPKRTSRPWSRRWESSRASCRSSRRARIGVARRRSATSTCSPRPPIPRR